MMDERERRQMMIAIILLFERSGNGSYTFDDAIEVLETMVRDLKVARSQMPT